MSFLFRYEVMQFCWLQPELRPSSEEVHLLVTYLCAKGSTEAEDDFEQRWNALRPNLLGSASHTAASTALVLTPTPASADDASAEQTQAVELASSASSSFPLLEQCSDSFHSDTVDDLLTVTETSHGLNFEYKWEQARAEQPYCSSSTSGPLGQGNPHYQDIYYSSTSGSCKTDSLTSGISPSYYQLEHPSVVPVLSAHSPSVSSEYYIRIEEPVDCNINVNDNVVDYSPGLEASSSRLSSQSQSSSSIEQPTAYWATAGRSTAYDCDSSPTVQLNMKPALRQASSTRPAQLVHSHSCLSSNQDDKVTRERPSASQMRHHFCLSELDTAAESKSSQRLTNPHSSLQAVSSPSLGFCDPYLEEGTGRRMVNDNCGNMMVPLRKTLPIVNHISIDVGTGDGLLVNQQRSDDLEDDLFTEGEPTNWISNRSANNNSLSFVLKHAGDGNGSNPDIRCADHTATNELWSLTNMRTFQRSRSCGTSEAEGGDTSREPNELSSHIQFHPKDREEITSPMERKLPAGTLRSIDSHTSVSINASDTEAGKMEELYEKKLLLHGERLYNDPTGIHEESYLKSASSLREPQTGQTGTVVVKQRGLCWEEVSAGISVGLGDKRLHYAETSVSSRTLDSGVGVSNSSSSLPELGDYSEDEEDDITSGIFADFNLDYAEEEEEELSPVKNPERTADSVDAHNLSSSVASTSDQAFSPDPLNTPVLPKSLDSGYDTEINESPEFLFKELGEPLGVERRPRLDGEPEPTLHLGLGQGVCASSGASELQLKSLTDDNPYRDSAYFSDYDAENGRGSPEEKSKFRKGSTKGEITGETVIIVREDESFDRRFDDNGHFTNLRHKKSCALGNLSEAHPNSPHHIPTPGLSMLSPFPPQMGGCLTKGSAPVEDDLGLETEHAGEQPSSEISSFIGSDPSSDVQEASGNCEEGHRRADDRSPVQHVLSESTVTDYGEETPKENKHGDGSTEEEEFPEFSQARDDTKDRDEAVRINEDDFEDIDAEESDSQDSLCEESHRPVGISSSSSLLELCGEEVRAPLEEAEDEDDSDDSESDEELRTYNVQDEESEESEEDFTTVPVVVSDCSRAGHLRSLLRMPNLLSQSFCDELERKKKAVSFFDDVTVFLFDQVWHGNRADFYHMYHLFTIVSSEYVLRGRNFFLVYDF